MHEACFVDTRSGKGRAVPNPQQPELRRSGRGATSDNSAKAMPAHESGHPNDDLPEQLVPDDNRSGARPEQDQDKPDLDDFAERLGIDDDATDAADATRPAPSRLTDQHD